MLETTPERDYMRVLSGVIVTLCSILIVLYAYLGRLATVALIVFMGIVVWLIITFSSVLGILRERPPDKLPEHL